MVETVQSAASSSQLLPPSLSLGFLHCPPDQSSPLHCCTITLGPLQGRGVLFKQKLDHVTFLLSKPSTGFPPYLQKKAFHIWPLAPAPAIPLLTLCQSTGTTFIPRIWHTGFYFSSFVLDIPSAWTALLFF